MSKSQFASGSPAPREEPGGCLLVEEKPVCREALSQLLVRCGLPPPDCVGSAPEADGQVAPAYGLVVVDLFTVNYDFRWLEALIRKVAGAPVVALDDRRNPALSDLARKAGVRAYASKDMAAEEIEEVIAIARTGQPVFPPPLMGERCGSARAEGSRQLTRRQLEVLAHLGQGMTNREIATALDITPGTVKLHIHQVLKLTGSRNRTEAALIAPRFLAASLAGPEEPE